MCWASFALSSLQICGCALHPTSPSCQRCWGHYREHGGSSRLFVLFTRSSTITYISINSPGTSASITIGAASAADVGGGKEGGG